MSNSSLVHVNNTVEMTTSLFKILLVLTVLVVLPEHSNSACIFIDNTFEVNSWFCRSFCNRAPIDENVILCADTTPNNSTSCMT